ncbi:hypothetical protein BJ878DRAFT_545280 [Calycina marina]|uniref:Luciferase-like domain-containing protein n=1 Tax=Calycina marina TaxID=1763456 RepID=A0A9P7YWQ6_9HELO|nr:hypothetical protein BJ878DRAFT_545280 [Calycina marina]
MTPGEMFRRTAGNRRTIAESNRTPNIVDPSPERITFLFQAGTSRAGPEFAVKHAEAIFVSSHLMAEVAPKTFAMRKLAAERGRNPRSIKLFSTFSPILGLTDEEAQAKIANLKKYTIGWLVIISG